MNNQQHQVIRRRRNLPAELKVEIVDCLPLENAAHFLGNVPNRLIIHHCAPRIRRILNMIDQIVDDYARTPTVDSEGNIQPFNGYKYTPEMDFFLRYGDAYTDVFLIPRGTRTGFVGYPVDFFNDLIKHYYETKVPLNAIRYVFILLPLENPAPWPAALVKPEAGKINVEELEVLSARKSVEYILRNKYNPGIAFKLRIYFKGDAKCYQEMTNFIMWREEDVQSCEA